MRQEWRVNGPYKHGRWWRLAFTRGSGERRKTKYKKFRTAQAAEDWLEEAGNQTQGTTVKAAVDAFLEAKRTNGLAGSTIENYEFRLVRLLDLPANAMRPIRWVTVAGRGAEMYLRSVYGAGDTHINGLNVGRMWGAWCVKKRILKVNPFAEVEAVGRKTHGSTKPRLTVNESRQLEAYCLANASDPDCVLTYGYLMLGKRASELVGITVRDLDDDGWLVRIRKAKTAASVKPVRVPAVLREMLLALATGKAMDASLFVNLEGDPMSRFVARDRVKAVCKAAGVPELSPQALRRTFVDNAGEQGFALRTIAEQTGHTTPAVTLRSYASPEKVEAQAVERNFKVMQGGRK